MIVEKASCAIRYRFRPRLVTGNSNSYATRYSTRQILFSRFSRVKILFIGDIVGAPGRRAVKEILPRLKEQHGIDVVIANSENAAGGSGITPAIAAEIYETGVHAITMGDHLWD